MLEGLSFIWEHRLAQEGAKVAVTVDSMVVLHLLSREWNAHNHILMNLVTEVEKLVCFCLWKMQYENVPQKQNEEADTMCH